MIRQDYLDKSVIRGINEGKESSFRVLYDHYFTYLCVCATSYIFDTEKAKELVNDVFINVWARRETLDYPIHSYLVQSIKYASLNHIRTLKSQLTFMDQYKEELFVHQEEYCLSELNPLNILEIKELEQRIVGVINLLPSKCQTIFKYYLFEGLSPKEIGEKLGISVNTVRVQIKIALDKIKLQLGPFVGILFLFFSRK